MWNKVKSFLLKALDWHSKIGFFFDCILIVAFLGGVIGLVLGVKSCKKSDEIVYTNIFLNETFVLHDNYNVTVASAKTVEEINILDEKGNNTSIEGHYASIDITIHQRDDGNSKPHSFDKNDFKLKGHTGVYLPLSDIGSLVGWDLIDVHWDKKDNGYVISSADISTKDAVKDYNYIDKVISPGDYYTFTIHIPISNKTYKVETSIMVLEVDFMRGGAFNDKKRGEDVILLPRPENLKSNSEST